MWVLECNSSPMPEQRTLLSAELSTSPASVPVISSREIPFNKNIKDSFCVIFFKPVFVWFCVWRTEVNIRYLPCSLPHFLREGPSLSLVLTDSLGYLVYKTWGPPVFDSSGLEMEARTAAPGLFSWVKGITRRSSCFRYMHISD